MGWTAVVLAPGCESAAPAPCEPLPDVLLGPVAIGDVLRVEPREGQRFLAVSDGRQVRVRAGGLDFVPVEVEPFEVVAEVATGQACGLASVRVRGCGVRVERLVRAVPASVDFGAVPLSEVKEVTVTVESWSRQVLRVTFDGGPSSFELPPAHTTTPARVVRGDLQPGLSRLVVRYAPRALGEERGTFDGATRFTLAVSGRAVGPRLVLTPSPVLDFGAVALPSAGLTSAIQRLTVRNEPRPPDTGAPLEVSLVAEGGGLCLVPPEEVACSPEPLSLQVPPGEAVRPGVRIRASAPGELRAGLRVLSNDVAQPELRLEVRAQVEPRRACTLSWSSTSLDLGVLQSPLESEASVTATNLGTEDCTWSTPHLEGRDRELLRVVAPGTAWGTLSPGQSVAFTVRGTGRESQEASSTLAATLVINTSDATHLEHRLGLLGQLTESCLRVLPRRIDLGIRRPGCSTEEVPIRVANLCGAPVESLRASGRAGPDGGALALDVPGGLTRLPSGGLATVRVARFTVLDGQGVSAHVEVAGRVGGADVRRRIPFTLMAGASPRMSEALQVVSPARGAVLFVVDTSPAMEPLRQAVTELVTRVVSRAQVPVVGLTSMEVGSALTVFSTRQPGLADTFRQAMLHLPPAIGEARCLDAALALLEGPAQAGLLRGQPALSVLCVSNSPEKSWGAVTSSLDGLRQRAGPAVSVSVSAMVHVGAPGCPGERDDGRYAAITRLADGELGDVCAGRPLTGGWNVGGPSSFGLRGLPDLAAGPLSVFVDGQELPDTDTRGARVWEYEPRLNELHLEALYVPERGRELVVTYVPRCR